MHLWPDCGCHTNARSHQPSTKQAMNDAIADGVMMKNLLIRRRSKQLQEDSKKKSSLGMALKATAKSLDHDY
jgi:hypothetical protein